jgi:CBS domain-containing protein
MMFAEAACSHTSDGRHCGRSLPESLWRRGGIAEMKVHELMTSQVLSIREEDSVAQAVEMMLWAGVRHLPVVRGTQVVGVLTEGGILAQKTQPLVTQGVTRVGDVMRQPAEVAAPDDDVGDAAARMAKNRIGCLPVARNGSLVGILTRSDVLAVTAHTRVPVGAGVLRVSQAMNADPVVIHGDDDLLDAAARMVQHGIRHLPVVDGEDRVIGILSDRDVRTAIGDPRRALDDTEVQARIRALKVWAAMMTPALTVGPDEPLSHAVRFFVDRRVGALPVVDDAQRPVGMLSYVDALRVLDERGRAFER